MKKLMLLIIAMLCVVFTKSYAQKETAVDTVCMTVSEFKQVLKLEANYNLKLKQVNFLVQDTAKLKKEINRKEAVIVKILSQRDGYRMLVDTAQQVIAAKEEVIAAQDARIKRLGRVKRWSLGPNVSYGTSGNKMAVFVGIGVMYKIIRF